MMRRREQLQYHMRWVRMICCLSWAVMIMDASHFHILGTIDTALVDVLTDGQMVSTHPVSHGIEWILVLIMCLVPAVPRFRRPPTMILCGILLLFLDLLLTAGGYLLADVLLPMASPLIGLFGSSAVLGMMAWHEERVRSTTMERLEGARVQFTDMLVHDLKKRISSVLVSLSLLEQKSPAGGDDAELLSLMRTSVERMLLEVTNLLDIRKIEERGMRLSLDKVDAAGFLEGIVNEHQPAARLAGLTIRLDPAGPVDFQADRHMFSRVMTNLIWNAIQHAKSASAIVVAYSRDADAVIISVANRGEPIQAHRYPMMFQPFGGSALEALNDRSEGTGLGLAFCKLAVDAHGGRIGLESPWAECGDGVRVMIRIPMIR